ncbi:MAG: response regulator [Bacteroidota bacterium]|nr:response regulator [Bacteroidota bacterium]
MKIAGLQIKVKTLLSILLLFCCTVVFSQEQSGAQLFTLNEYRAASKAIFTSVFFLGAFLVMGFYMLLLYIQNKKKDYLYYAVYLIIFTIYFFLRTDSVVKFDLFNLGQSYYYYLLTPLLLVITGVYVKFINIFAEIEKYDRDFASRLNIFSKLLYTIAGLIFLFTLFTDQLEVVERYQHFVMIPMHLYTLIALIRAFLVIKSNLRYYVLFANLFLFAFSILGVYAAQGHNFSENVTSHHLLGFYTFNASQLGTFLEMICFSLGLGYKFSLIEKEKDEVKQKYIEQLKENEEVSKKLNEELSELVAERTKELEKKTSLLEKEQQLKSKLYVDISHEFRTPLTLISGPTEAKLREGNLSDADYNLFSMIKRNASRLLSLVNQLLDLAKLDKGRLKLKINQGNLGLLINFIASSFEFKTSAKKIQYSYNIQSIPKAWFDEDIIEKIVTNLLSNALKYCPENGICELDASKKDKTLFLKIRNSVDDIYEIPLDKLFNRFYQNNEYAEGAGIGLSLVKELVQLHKGSIDVSAKEDNTIEFTVQIPIGKTSFSPNDIVPVPKKVPKLMVENNGPGENRSSNLEETKDGLPILLVVEDNKDVRDFIKSSLKTNYSIYEAKNGQFGIEEALRLIPDVILSDIKMPVMDGITMCNKLKQDQRTSHIPIVLLTAGVGEEQELKSLKSGADDFIVKPFKLPILEKRLANLIEVRKALRDRYSKEFVLKPNDISITSAEEAFLNKIQKILDKELSNSDFNAAKLSEMLGISRMQLHRKLLAYTNLSTSNFIRSQRLKQALAMLENSKANINEIAYSVGFNTPSYFIKCFKETYNKTPLEYSQSIHNQ